MIFAAGLGTRLKPLTDRMPKALVPVGREPLLEILLRKLKKEGYDDIVINVHHFADMIEEWCSEHPMEGVKISFSDEREQLLETGGAIKHAKPMLQDTDRFLIHNVDILSDVDLKAFREASAGSDAALLVSERQTQRYLIFDNEMRLVGWTNIKTGEVKSPYPAVHEAFNPNFVSSVNTVTAQMSPIQFVPSEHSYQLYAFSGIHQMSTKMLPLMDSYPEKFSIIDFYLQNCHDNVIRGVVQPEMRLMDVGKIDTLNEAEEFIKTI